MEDIEILNKLKNNDRKAFEVIFRRYFIPLNEYAKFYTGSLQLAEDIVHDVFYKIWERRETLAIHTSIKSYLYKSVHNNCIQYLRHQKVVNKHSINHKARLEEALIMNQFYFESGLSKLFEKEIGDLVEKAVARLPEKSREIFIMSRQRHLKNSKIAELLKLSEKSVEYHITRVLVILRQELDDYLPLIMIVPVILI